MVSLSIILQLVALKNACSSIDGRVTLTLVGDQVEIKYQHLNPATYFQEVVDVARAVVLAGGTMSPVSHSNSPFLLSLIRAVAL
jgi:chromosome transmission fidelity protein 1